MKTRRTFLRILPLCTAPMATPQLAVAADVAASATPPTGPKAVRFGVIADCQYADIPDNPKSQRLYRRSPGKLQSAIQALNESPVPLDFIVNLGDTIDKNFESFDTVLPLFAAAKAPVYHLLGNHDYDVADELKRSVPSRLRINPARPHRSWGIGKWRFIALDGNDVSLFAHPKGSLAQRAAQQRFDQMTPKPAAYNGAIGEEQLRWLTQELQAARQAGQRAILFCHYPIFPENHHNLWNAEDVLELVSRHDDVVVAWMNGHNHAGNYGLAHGIHCLTFKGMVDTAENCWAQVTLTPSEIMVEGFEREPDRRWEWQR